MANDCAICCEPCARADEADADAARGSATLTVCAHTLCAPLIMKILTRLSQNALSTITDTRSRCVNSHSACLARWIEQRPFNPTCPICRTKLHDEAKRRVPAVSREEALDRLRGAVTAAREAQVPEELVARSLQEVERLVGDLNRALDLTTPTPGSEDSPLLRAEAGFSRTINPVISRRARELAPRATYSRRSYLIPPADRAQADVGQSITPPSDNEVSAYISWARERVATLGQRDVPGHQLARYLSR